MIVLEKFQAVHFERIRAKPEVAMQIGHITAAHALALEDAHYAYTFMRGDDIVACAGVAEYWPNRGEAWALLFTELRHDFVPTSPYRGSRGGGSRRRPPLDAAAWLSA